MPHVMNVRGHHIYWCQTRTFEVRDVLRGGEQCEDDKVRLQGRDGEMGMAWWEWRGGD